MSHAIEFIEASIFTRQIKELATDDELKDLKVELIAHFGRIFLVLAYSKSEKDSLTVNVGAKILPV